MSGKGKISLTIGFALLISLAGLYFALQIWMPFMWFFLAPGLICVLIWIYLERKILFDFFTMKTTRQGLNMGALILLAAVILVFVNFMAGRYNRTFDFSTTDKFTLSEQSKKILDNLKNDSADVQVKYFYKEGLEGVEANKKIFSNMVKIFQDYSSDARSKIKMEFIEMNSRPKITQEFGATKGAGEGFIEYNGQKNRIESQGSSANAANYSEQDFINALIKTTRKEKKKIYFLQGHGERDAANEKSETGVSALKQMLEKNSYTVESYNMIEKGGLPMDANVIAIFNPENTFQKHEVNALQDYLNNGGALLLTFDEKNMAGLADLIKLMGIAIEKNYIFNIFNSPSGPVINAQQPTVAVQYSPTSEITRFFASNSSSVFLRPSSIKLLDIPPTLQVDPLVKSPEASVALENFDSQQFNGQPQSYVLAVEVKGKLKENAANNFSAVVFADTDFLSNQFIYQNSNKDLVLNTLSALAQEKDLIAIAPKEPLASKMTMTVPEFNQYYKFVVVGLFLPIPFLFLIISFVMWLRRRHA